TPCLLGVLLLCAFFAFFVNDTATTEIYTLSLHDALPISIDRSQHRQQGCRHLRRDQAACGANELMLNGQVQVWIIEGSGRGERRSEEHTSELQSRENLVCRLLLEKKKTETTQKHRRTRHQ